jgi:DNA-binding beta-propeller fold protein YncE
MRRGVALTTAAVAVLMAALLLGTADAKRADRGNEPKVACFHDGNNDVSFKTTPRKCTFVRPGCDIGACALPTKSLEWKNWGRPRAHAEGKGFITTVGWRPIEIHLGKIRDPKCGGPVYTKIKARYRGSDSSRSGRLDRCRAQTSNFDGSVLYVPNGDGVLHAYQEGTWTEIGSWQMPFRGPVRGSDADPSGGFLYIAYGGDGGVNGTGSLLKWNLMTESAEWNRSYPFGVDQFANCGGRIYMPTGEAATGSKVWEILDADTGDVVSSLTAGTKPHNTICHNGNVYMGGRSARYLFTASTTGTRMTAQEIGPTPSEYAGVRPFTVNAADTRTWMTWSKFRGFSIANSQTGQILATVNFGAVPSTFRGSAPSHGISLAPDGSEVYVLDTSLQQVQVYSGTDDPQPLAKIPLENPIEGKEVPCFIDCAKEGWLVHSRDGRYVFVGESGDVIDTRTRSVVATLPALVDDRHGFIEVNWNSGVPVTTSSHFGIGR